MNCASAEALGYQGLDGIRVCEDPPATLGPRDVYVNVLGKTMPECDRALEPVASSPTVLEGAEHCYVYCAQRSCEASANALREHRDQYDAACPNGITYLHNGALSMNRDELVDGDACHAKIIDFNKDASKPCLTCGDDGVPIPVQVDGTDDPSARFSTTEEGTIPDWYARANIHASLPTPFHCDARYHNPPQTHGEGRQRVTVDVSSVLPTMTDKTTVAYWAATSADDVREAHVAYDDFQNSGIVECTSGVCEFELDPPGRYTADGINFRPHLHFAEWKGDRWSRTVHTVAYRP